MDEKDGFHTIRDHPWKLPPRTTKNRSQTSGTAGSAKTTAARQMVWDFCRTKFELFKLL